MKIVLELEIRDDEIAASASSNPIGFHKRVQGALDKAWPYARMESVRIVKMVLDADFTK